MKETPRQYIKRILGYQRGKAPMAVLSSSPREIAGLLRGASRKKLTARPGRGRWSVVEILAHLADTEVVFGFRLRLVLGSNGTRVQGFDQDAWARSCRYRKQDPRLSLEAYRVQRAHNLRLLKLLPKGMWGYYGIHSERGKETVTRMSRMMAGHDINHTMQIERLLRSRSSR
jgi:hypothetical protein